MFYLRSSALVLVKMRQKPIERKERLENSIRILRFNENYDAYQKEHIVRFREPFWKEIDLKEGEGSTADFFFSVYQEYVKVEQ